MDTQQIIDLAWGLMWPILTFLFFLGIIFRLFYQMYQMIRTDNYKQRRLYDKLIFGQADRFNEEPNPDPEIGDRCVIHGMTHIWDGNKWVKI